MASQSNEILLGQQKPNSTYGDYNNLNFIIQQALSKLQTSTIVKIISCTNNGELSPVGFVDVQPLINQIDGNGVGIPHGIIYNIPYVRIQGGNNAIIIDPIVGDMGICLFANRDITNVKNTKTQSNPGSYRTFNFADGIYIGGLLNGIPSQYIQFNASGIKLHSSTSVNLEAPNVSIACSTLEIVASSSVTVTTPSFNITGIMSAVAGEVNVTGIINATGDIVGNGISLDTHTHTSNTPGNPTSPPL